MKLASFALLSGLLGLAHAYTEGFPYKQENPRPGNPCKEDSSCINQDNGGHCWGANNNDVYHNVLIINGVGTCEKEDGDCICTVPDGTDKQKAICQEYYPDASQPDVVVDNACVKNNQLWCDIHCQDPNNCSLDRRGVSKKNTCS